MGDVPAALQIAGEWLRETQKVEPIAVGHRVVHGGPKYDQPVLVDATVLTDLERYSSLAPLHQPNNLAPIRSVLARFPGPPGKLVSIGPISRHGALPITTRSRSALADGVRRYGFHGLSSNTSRAACQLAPEMHRGSPRCPRGSNASNARLTAVARGSTRALPRSTAANGHTTGPDRSRCHPLSYRRKKMTAAEVQKLLYGECGLKGLSGISNDVRELEASSDQRARFALEYFAYRVDLNAGMLAAALGGLDAFVFTAGIGENSPTMRARIVEKIAWLGGILNPQANAAGETSIAASDSRVGLYVVPTDEELMIAHHTSALLRSGTGKPRVLIT